MKKILIVSDNFKEQINGVATTFKNIEQYANLDRYEFVYFDVSGFSYIDCPGYPDVKLSFPIGIGKQIKHINPDYIHIATEGPLGLASRIWLNRQNWKYNTSYHTKFPEFIKEIYGLPTTIPYMYMRWFHKHSEKVLTTTKTMVDDLKSQGFSGNIIPWTRGVNKDIFKSSLRNNIQRPLTLINVGRVSKEKGLDDFCQLEYNATKIIVGDGPYRQELQRKYPDVIFTGMKRGTELAELFANADVFVFPSKTDTFGIVIIESLSVGTPVAAYPVPGPKDIIEEGVTGSMSWDLKKAIDKCLLLNRNVVEEKSNHWSWKNCWDIFRDNLIIK